MLKHCPSRYARVAMFSVALMTATTAQASIVLPGGDIFLDGSFQGMTYGASGSANLAPLLYAGGLSGTALPPFTQVSGSGLDFSYDTPVFGASSVTFTYRLTNNDSIGEPYSDLRFFLDLKTKGQASFQDTTAVAGFGAPTVPGAADHFQIFDFNAAGDKPLQQIASTSNLNDSTAAACSTGCFSDLALQWNRPELLVGDTWEIKATLVDDPSLVAGGRYLLASSLGADGTQIIFGSPTPVPLPPALLLLGSGLAWLFAFRRRQV